MRGGCPIPAALGLSLVILLGACAAPAPAPEAEKPKPAEAPASIPPLGAEKVYRVPPSEPGPESGIKGAGTIPVKADATRRDPGYDELLRLQKEIVGRNPGSDDDKLRLALLYATDGKLEEAEQVLSQVRTRSNKLVPYIEFFLRRQLGDHKEAGKLLSLFSDEDKMATGFVIERAILCSAVRRFRDYTPTESDRVRPGEKILIYIEPRNFVLQRSQDKHILHLKYEWKLYDDRSTELQVPAWERAKPEDCEDRLAVNGPVSEFFQSFKLPLPDNLAMGHYRVKVTVTDAGTNKSDRVFLPLYVTAVEGKR